MNHFMNQLKHKSSSYKNPYFRFFKTEAMVQTKIEFKKKQENQKYIDIVIENKNILVNKIKKDKKIDRNTTYAVSLVRNSILYPAELNREFNNEFNCMDKYQSLKNFPEILQQVDAQENPTGKSDQTSTSRAKGGVKGSIGPVSQSPNVHNPHNSSPGSMNGEKIGKQKVLIVDDCEFQLGILQKLLTHCKVDYEACVGGTEACQKFEEYLKEGKMFDFVLMDLYMPIMDGFKAAQNMRDLEIKYKVDPRERHFICGHSSEASLCKSNSIYNIYSCDV